MAAIIYVDGYEPNADTPVGIDVATDGFLDAYVRYGRTNEISAFARNEQAILGLQRRLIIAGKPADGYRILGPDDIEAIESVGCIFRYDPAISDLSWTRRHYGQRRYSLCGITHTSSTQRAMDLASGLVTAPTQPWDALICASHAIRSAILSLVEGWSDYLGSRVGAPALPCPVQFPVIPLGIDLAGFQAVTTKSDRHRQREQLSVGEDEILILFVGRLNFYAKANPFAQLYGVERVAEKTEKSVHLIFHGYFSDDDDEEAFKEAARTICRKSKVTFIIEGDPRFPDGLWAGADIFCSLVDNIQESFGLTPVEAMASGLPVIVSDWDGYRDTVRNGVDGYAIPTLIPQAGAGQDLALRLSQGQDGYGEYLAATAQATAIDLEALVPALEKLVINPDLRRSMGDAGRERVAQCFDWPHVIKAYEELWEELAARRKTDPESAPPPENRSPNPLRPDPFEMFREFSTESVADEGKFELVVSEWKDVISRIGLKVSLFNSSSIIDLEDLPILMAQLEIAPKSTSDELVGALAPLPEGKVLRTLVWLVKLGICRYQAPGQTS